MVKHGQIVINIMNKIYVVQTWESESECPWGHCRNVELYFSTREKAMKWINDRDLRLVEYCQYPERDVTLYEEVVDGY